MFWIPRTGRIRLNTLLDSKITDDGTIYQNDQAVARIQVTDFEDYDYLGKIWRDLLSAH